MKIRIRSVGTFIMACFVLFSFVTVVSAADIYIGQSTAGSGDGSSCSNARPASWFNTSSNWANPKQAGRIGPGDTVHLCGTISTPLQFQASGSSGNAITILFESGAKMSAPNWYQGGSNGSAAIYGNGVSYITVDGGANGLIECTDNGTNKTYQLHSVGVEFDTSSNIEVKNLTVQHIYDRVQGTDSHAVGGCIQFRSGANNINIHNNTVYDANVPIYIAYGIGNQNISIYNNTGGRAGEGVVVIGANNVNCTLNNVLIYNNTFTKGLEWSGQPSVHTNLIHTHAVQQNSAITGIRTYNNTFSGVCGSNSTSLVFFEGNIYAPWFYNNLVKYTVGDLSGCGNGMAVIANIDRSNSSIIANNTFVNENGAGGLALGIGGYPNSILGYNFIINNNLFYNIGFPIIDAFDTTSVSQCDYNVYYSSNQSYPNFLYGNYSPLNYTQWKTALTSKGVSTADANSTASQPSLDANYAPVSTDAVAKGKGVNLSNYFTTDKNGTTRPPNANWSIGAFEEGGAPALPAPTNLRVQGS